MDSLKDGSVLSNVTRWGQTETTNETSGKIGEDITVQVGHNHDGIGERSGVGSDLYMSRLPKSVDCLLTRRQTRSNRSSS